ncbi:uncharacterized protein LOC117827126 [Notolabrus celidotus]|uniref:uncharacterized protein LOC117827126 n=1 Tax=Notolabrus celidotus TaxID=1203425 RepID=UPI00148FBFDA|nr:uncharacterized protein LOC117827126 [Notolabrus celidotus]
MADPYEVKPDRRLLRSRRIAVCRSDPGGNRLPKTEPKIVLVQRPGKEERREFAVQSQQPICSSRLTNDVKQPEDAAVTLIKAPVVWSPLTVKAAVSRLSEGHHAVKTSPPAPMVIKQEVCDPLPKVTVAWSPLTVQAAVKRLSVVQHEQRTQPSAHVLVKRHAENAFGSTILPKLSRRTPSVIPKVAQPEVPKREIRVIQTGRHHRSKVLHGPWDRVGDNLLRGRFKCLPKTIMKVPGLKDIMIAEVLKVLDKECDTLTSMTFNSVLRENDPVALKDFCWDEVMKEWKTAAPTFFKFLRHASKVFENSTADQAYTPKDRSIPMAMGGALLLRARSSSMCAPMYINSMILQQEGTRKRCIDQLNRVGICMSHRRMQTRLKNIEETLDGELVRWEDTEETDTATNDSDEEKEGSSYEDGDSNVPEITYIVS